MYNFNHVSIGSCLNTLPIGIEISNQDKTSYIERRVTYRKLNREEIKKIKDRKLAANHPFKWIGMVISYLVDSFGDIPVYDEYAKNGFDINKLPEIVSEIPASDSNFILFAGHIFNFGSKIKDVKVKCRNTLCDRESTFELDLSNELMVFTVPDKLDFNRILEVTLPTGYKFVSSEESDPSLYRVFKFRIPVLGDAIKQERWYQPNDQGSFHERIYADCTLSVETTDGLEFPPERLALIGPSMYLKLEADDNAELENIMNEIPRIDTRLTKICWNCSEDISFFVSTIYLFPS